MHTPAPWWSAFSVALFLAAHSATPLADGFPHRWVNASDVVLRKGISPDDPVVATLQRGAELELQREWAGVDYCRVASPIHQGYVACEFLSAKPVAFERAGEAGTDADVRWITRSAVVLRAQAAPDATVLRRLGVNERTRLVSDASADDFCEVTIDVNERGFVACRYLATSPVDALKRYSPLDWSGQPNPDYDPVTLFWMAPSWAALDAYASVLAQRHRDEVGNRWPRDDALEAMKAELAKGVHGSKAEPLPDWADIRRRATHSIVFERDIGAPEHAGQTGANDVEFLRERTEDLASTWRDQLGLWGPRFESFSGPGTERVIGFVRAIEVPSIRPSLFKRENELAPPGTADTLSGRFGIVHRWTSAARPQPAADAPDYLGPGLYDMLSRTQALVRSVQKVQLFRDGHLHYTPTVARSTETFWRDVDEEECAGWEPGFSYGDADAKIWAYVYGDSGAAPERTKNRGRLFEIYVPAALPYVQATVRLRETAMDREATGFVRGTQLDYDLDSDGVPDLLVWEGVGHGPGHLDGETPTDDAWYRLVLVNVAGRWKVLGHDEFGYGCGC